MLLYFLFPVLAGSIHWLIHSSKEELTERNKYRRMQVFGAILFIILVLSIFFVFALAAEADTSAAGKIAGRQIVWIAITASAGWRWIRTMWRPFEGKSLDQSSADNLEGFMGLQFGDNAKSFGQNKITKQRSFGDFLGIKSGGSAKQDREHFRRSNQHTKVESQRISEILGNINDPTIADMVSELVPEKTVQNSRQRDEGEFEFDQASRMFIPKEGRSTESSKGSEISKNASLPLAKLQELKTAFDQGLIDADEYSALKKQILGL